MFYYYTAMICAFDFTMRINKRHNNNTVSVHFNHL